MDILDEVIDWIRRSIEDLDAEAQAYRENGNGMLAERSNYSRIGFENLLDHIVCLKENQENHQPKEKAKPTIEEIAKKFLHEVLPNIGDIVNDDQFEGYVFAYIMAHDGWDWDNARDVEFLSMFSGG